MRNNNVEVVAFRNYESITLPRYTQYDRGQIIEFEDIPDGTEVQFKDGDSTINAIVNDKSITIPDSMFETSGTRTAWVVVFNEDSTTTIRTLQFAVVPKNKSSDYVPPAEEPTFREQMTQIMNETKSVAESVRSDADAGKFDGAPGPQGDPGTPGMNGSDGYSPEAKIERTKNGAKITITDAKGTTEAEVYDGQGGSGGDVTKAYVDQQDTALDQKFTGMYNGAEAHISGVSQGLTQFAQAQSAKNAEIEDELGQRPTDVQINGQSILDENKVANIPVIDYNTPLGLFYFREGYGFSRGGAKGDVIYQTKATPSDLMLRTNPYNPVVSQNLDLAVKLAMCDGKGADWTDEEKTMAQRRMGILSTEGVTF